MPADPTDFSNFPAAPTATVAPPPQPTPAASPVGPAAAPVQAADPLDFSNFPVGDTDFSNFPRDPQQLAQEGMQQSGLIRSGLIDGGKDGWAPDMSFEQKKAVAAEKEKQAQGHKDYWQIKGEEAEQAAQDFQKIYYGSADAAHNYLFNTLPQQLKALPQKIEELPAAVEGAYYGSADAAHNYLFHTMPQQIREARAAERARPPMTDEEMKKATMEVLSGEAEDLHPEAMAEVLKTPIEGGLAGVAQFGTAVLADLPAHAARALMTPPRFFNGTPEEKKAYEDYYFDQQARLAGGADMFNYEVNSAIRKVAKSTGVDPDSTAFQLWSLVGPMGLPVGGELMGSERIAASIARASQMGMPAAKLLAMYSPELITSASVLDAAKAIGLPHNIVTLGEYAMGAGGVRAEASLTTKFLKAIKVLDRPEVAKNLRIAMNAPGGVNAAEWATNTTAQEIVKLEKRAQTLRSEINAGDLAKINAREANGDYTWSSESLPGKAKELRSTEEDIDDLNGKLTTMRAQGKFHVLMNDTASYITNMIANTTKAGLIGGAYGMLTAPTGQGGHGFVTGFQTGLGVGAVFAPIAAYGGMHGERLRYSRSALTEMGGEPALVNSLKDVPDAIRQQTVMVNGLARTLGGQVRVIDDAVAAKDPGFPRNAVPAGEPVGAAAMPANGYIDRTTNTLVLRKGALGEDTAYHELRHLMLSYVGEQLRLKAPQIMAPFEKAYGEAIGDPSFNIKDNPERVQKEMDAEIGKYVMKYVPPEVFYGGERGGDILKRVALKVVEPFMPDKMFIDPAFNTPVSRADIANMKSQLFKLGEYASARRMLLRARGAEAGKAGVGVTPGDIIGGGGGFPGAPQQPEEEPPGGAAAAPQPVPVAHPNYADEMAKIEAAERQARGGKGGKKAEAAITRATVEGGAKLHADAVGPDSDLITWRPSKFEEGKGTISGSRMDPNDPFHKILLERANLSDEAKTNLNNIEANIGRTISMDYLHAPKEGEGLEARKAARAESLAPERVEAKARWEKKPQTFVPTSIGFTPVSNKFTVSGFFPDTFLANAKEVIDWTKTQKGMQTFTDVNDPRLVQYLQQWTQNHDNGYDARGSPIKGTEKIPVEQTPGYTPFKIPGDFADQINAMMGDISARTGKTGLSEPQKQLQALAAVEAKNSPYWDPATGEVNAVRAGMGYDLERAFDTLRPELMSDIQQGSRVKDAEVMKPSGFEGDRGQLGLRGLPRREFVSAGLMPATKPPRVPPGRDLMPGTKKTPEQLNTDIERNRDEGANVVASTPESETIELGMDKRQMMALVGPQMYDKPIQEVTAKELLQNAFDASRSAGATMKNPKRIDITTDPDTRTITVKDTGAGMNKDIIKKAFFTVGGTYKTTDPSNTSGGLGLAKMAFMLGSDSVRLETVKDGFKHTVDATSDQIRNGTFSINTEKTNEPNGTLVTVKIPENYIDSNGETRGIRFDEKPNFLRRPLFGPVEVTLNGDVLPIGVHQTGFQPDNTFNFSWGKIHVYVDPKKTEFPEFQILSAGLHQFRMSDYEIYGFSEENKMPYNFVLDVRPKVKTDNPAYPFNNQREGFRGTIKDDIEAMKAYFQKQAVEQQLLEAKDVFAGLKQMTELDPTKNLTQEQIDRINAQYAASERRAAALPVRKIKSVDFGKSDIVIHYEDGGTRSLDRSEYVKESFQPEREVDLEKTGLDVSDLDPNKPLLHNNTNVNFDDIREAPELNTKLGNALIKFMREFGEKVGDDYEGLERDDAGGWFGGISYDKSYRGLNMVKPFKGIWFNPGGLSRDALRSPEAAASESLHIFIHEITHVEAKSEGARFTAELATNYARLRAHNVAVEKFETALSNIYAEHWDAFNDIHERFNDYNTKNRAASFKSAAALGPARPGEAARTGEGAPPVDVSGDERFQEQGRAGAGRAPAPDPAAGPVGVILEGQAAPTEERELMPATSQTPEFKRWFGESKVTDEEGKPLVVYHGTTHEFTSFDPGKANVENDWGRAVYFSNSPSDVAHNYAGLGPDLTNRIERRAENIHDEAMQLSPEELMNKFGVSKREANLILSEPKYGTPQYDKRRDLYHGLASKEVAGAHGGATMPVFLKMENPLELGGKKEPYWSLDYDEDTGEESGELVRLHDALLRAAAPFYEADGQKAFNEAIDKVGPDGKASDFIEALRHSDGIQYALDDNGDLASHEILRQTVENMGYDGVIDRLVNKKFGSERKVGKPMEGVTPDTIHYVAFEPTQIKSAIGNRTFDPHNPAIDMMPATRPTKELPDRFYVQERPGQDPEIVDRLTGKVIDTWEGPEPGEYSSSRGYNTPQEQADDENADRPPLPPNWAGPHPDAFIPEIIRQHPDRTWGIDGPNDTIVGKFNTPEEAQAVLDEAHRQIYSPEQPLRLETPPITPEAHAMLSDPSKDLDLSKDENFHAVNTIVPVKGSDTQHTMVDTDGRRFIGEFDPSIKVWPQLWGRDNQGRLDLMPATLVSSTPGVTIVKGLKELRGEPLRPEAPKTSYYRPTGELAQKEGDPKTIKGKKFGVQTFVMYTGASDSSGVMNACPHATRGPGGCIALCLVHNGQGGMPDGALARINKSRFFNYDRDVFMDKLDREITRNKAKVRAQDLEYAIRLNGTSDIKWEDEGIMDKHPDVQFYDYTKYPENQRPNLPSNYDITYSYTGDPISIQRSNDWAKNREMNTAVVFEGGMPAEFLGRPVIDGDVSDLRYKDPKGVIVGLHAKGDKALQMAREGTTGFIYKTPAEDVAIPYVYPQTKAALLKKYGESYINDIKDGLNPKYPAPKVNDLVWKRGDHFLGLNEGKTAPDPKNPGQGVMTPEMQRQYEAAQEAKIKIMAKQAREKIEAQTPFHEKGGYFAEPEVRVLRGYQKGGVVKGQTKSGVYLIRHGCTQLNAQASKRSPDVIRGHEDIPLNKKGHVQAAQLGKDLGGKGIKAVYSSDLSRAMDTGAPIAAANKTPLIPVFGLRPWDLGHKIQGHRADEVQPEIERLVDNPDEPAEGGESFNDFSSRFLSTMNHIVNSSKGHNVAVVTHYRGSKLLGALDKNGGVDTKKFKSQDGALDPGEFQFFAHPSENKQPMKGILRGSST